MNISTIPRQIIYFLVIIGLTLLLIREYSYIHPYNPGMGLLGPKWTYTSTKTPTWWFLLIASFLLVSPLIRKQKIGFFGLLLFIAILIRPYVQNKFPEETVNEFYSKRKIELNEIVKKNEPKNQTIIGEEIKKAGFEKLIVEDSIYYFFFFNEDFPFGICYTESKSFPDKTSIIGSDLKFNEIEQNWYELE